MLTSATGARTAVIWFKVCPALLSISAGLLLVASFVRVERTEQLPAFTAQAPDEEWRR